MAEKLVPIDLPPGVFHNGTRYQAKNRWYLTSLVRWYEGIMRPVGGWALLKDVAGVDVRVSGVPRGMIAWRGDS